MFELTNENALIAGVGDFVKAEKGDARKIHFDMPYGYSVVIRLTVKE